MSANINLIISQLNNSCLSIKKNLPHDYDGMVKFILALANNTASELVKACNTLPPHKAQTLLNDFGLAFVTVYKANIKDRK